MAPVPLEVPVLSTCEAVKALRKRLPPSANSFLAMYSSAVGGIVTDPALFTVPLDEHMVNRGHAVFDTCNVVKGKTYGLDFHLDRLLRSASLARIKPAFSKEQLRQIILATIASTQKREDVYCRFWLTAGRGDFNVSSRGTCGSNFFVIVHVCISKAELKTKGVHEYTVDVPLKPPLLATIKSNNYLLNALCTLEAEDKGGYLGIQLDEKGLVAESSIGNIAILDKDGVLRTPPVGNILAGTTIKRAFELASPLIEKGIVKNTEYSTVTLDDLLSAREVFSLGGGHIVPVVAVNGKFVDDGRPGAIFRELDRVLKIDMEKNFLDDIPYEKYAPSRGLKAVWCALARRLSRSMLLGAAVGMSLVVISRAGNRQAR